MSILREALGPVLDIVDKVVPDRNQAERIKGEIKTLSIENDGKALDASTGTAQADAKSDGWLTRNARPLTVFNMLAIMNVIVGTALVNPDLADRMVNALATVPNMVWGMIAGGVGVYQLVRSADKRWNR